MGFSMMADYNFPKQYLTGLRVPLSSQPCYFLYFRNFTTVNDPFQTGKVNQVVSRLMPKFLVEDRSDIEHCLGESSSLLLTQECLCDGKFSCSNKLLLKKNLRFEI